MGRAGRRARGADRLAPRAGDAALRPGRRAQAHVPAHRGRAQQEPAAAPARAAGDRRRRKDAEAFDRALDFVESWPRDDKREGVKVVLQALAEKKIGRRDQANNWIWRCANITREVHEEYAVQRWPETKRLLGLLVNSSGGAHARNARRLVHAARQQDRRLRAALLAAALPHTAEAGEVINGARTRMSRKPAALARELLRNFPKGKGKSQAPAAQEASRRRGRSRGRRRDGRRRAVDTSELEAPTFVETPAPQRRRSRRRRVSAERDAPGRAAARPRGRGAPSRTRRSHGGGVARPPRKTPAKPARARRTKPPRQESHARARPRPDANGEDRRRRGRGPDARARRRTKTASERPPERGGAQARARAAHEGRRRAPKTFPRKARGCAARAASPPQPRPRRSRRARAAPSRAPAEANGTLNALEEASERVRAAVREAAAAARRRRSPPKRVSAR